MNLVEAFQMAAPPDTPDRVESSRRREACELVHGLLVEIARQAQSSKAWPFAGNTTEQVEDAAMMVLLRHVGAGPRGARPGGPDTEAAVRAWFRRCLHNQLVDSWRLTRRESELEEARQPDSPLESEDPAPGLQRLEGLLTRLREEIIPKVRAELRAVAADNLDLAVHEWMEVLNGRASVDDLVAGAGRTAKNALYKRHQRARERTLEWLQRSVASGELSREDADLFGRLLQGIRLKP